MSVLRAAGAAITALTLAAGLVLLPSRPAFADPGGSGLADPPSSLRDGASPPEETSSTDYGRADWEAASTKNYTKADRPGDHRIRYVVIHVMQGSYEGTKAWFKNPKAQVTTHYIMRAEDGHVTQMVRERDIAWHAGNWDVNTESIGIEHEGYVDERKWFTDTVYRSSAALVRDICERYDIPMDRKHIIGHVEVPGADHTDPGKYWDWDKYMTYLTEKPDDGSSPGAEIVVDDATTDRVTAGDAWTSESIAGQYGDSVHTTNPVLSSDPLWYRVAVPATGRYRVDVRYPAAEGNNSRTPYLVRTASGNESVFVDQRSGGAEWEPLGTFELAAGDYDAVGVSRWTGGEGRIVADAVRVVGV